MTETPHTHTHTQPHSDYYNYPLAHVLLIYYALCTLNFYALWFPTAIEFLTN